MGLIFDNGATCARAAAWGLWALFVAAGTGIVFVSGSMSASGWLGLLLVFGLGSRLILVRLRPLKIPVLNYHSVSANPEWLRIGDRVSESPAAFERQLMYLKRHGYRSLTISELRGFLAGVSRLDPPGKYVALTLDDGYADNWIAAFPLLKKYGMKATMFVSSAFVDDAACCRRTIDDCAESKWAELDWSGYLTWPELRVMQHSGLVEIQSHGHAHTRVFAKAELQGFVGPTKANLWLLWSLRPEIRTRWWQEFEADRTMWGQPVFRQMPALAHRAYRPDPEAVAHIMSWAQDQSRRVFDKPDWERRLHEEWRRHIYGHGGGGSWESQEAYEQRVEDDLREAKTMLERELGVRVDALCWPENAFSEAGERLAGQTGYTVTVSNRHNSRNMIGEAPDRLARVFIGSHAIGFRSSGLDFAAFVLELKVFEGWYVMYPALFCIHRTKKLVWTIRQLLSPRGDYVSAWT
jgi:peptidoglycan/xylan/chitin deacetylase (PgdA/CDA1 family)